MSRLEFEPGLTHLGVPTARSPVLHQVVGARLSESNGDAPAYWIDARNAASTHVLYDSVASQRILGELEIARAFTAYQHHSLVRQVTREVDADTTLIVAPNVVDLYRDDDLPEWERTDLLAATLTTLREIGHALECPVLVTTTSETAAERVVEYADHDVDCKRTREGYRLDGDGATTAGYWHGTQWQTTIPYWVDICGVVDSIDIGSGTIGSGTLDAGEIGSIGIDTVADEQGLFEVGS